MIELGLLPFAVGDITKLQECNIDTTNLRKSLDGTKALVHLQNLTISQFNAFRVKTSIQAMTYEQVEELMATPEWSVTE